jgi:hypothetical protein
MILSLLLPILRSIGTGIEYNSAEPFFYGVRKPIILITAGVIIVLLILLVVKQLNRIRKNKTKDD